jgi:hypothetical protein
MGLKVGGDVGRYGRLNGIRSYEEPLQGWDNGAGASLE